MRWIAYRAADGTEGVGLATQGGYRGMPVANLGTDLLGLVECGTEAQADTASILSAQPIMGVDELALMPVLPRPPKVICIGLNYRSHAEESGFAAPEYPAILARWGSSLVAHGAPIVSPNSSEQLDYEGELAVIIGRGERHVTEADALHHVGGYSIFNDGSIRDYQTRTPQWTIGKNCDGTGGFGPELITLDELPLGARGLTIETRLNGAVVQSASTDDLIFDLGHLISLLSEAVTLSPGDVIVSGTPAGVGAAREPPLWIKPGDVCEVTIEGIGNLVNPIVKEA